MKFEKNEPFVYESNYYRIANPVVKSLRYFHYANSNGWSHGPEKISRYGSLYFDFPTVKEKLAGDAVGKSLDGTPALPRIFWDGDQNRFSGAAAQHVNNKPLYQVDVDWSRDFEALTPKLNQTVVAGGASADGHWHHWETIVPEKHELLLTLTVPQREGPAKVIEKRFGPGYRLLQLGFQLEKDAPAASLLLLIGKDGKDLKETFELPQQLGDRPATHPPITHILNPGESARVLSRTLKSSTESVTLDVKLLAR